MIGTHILSLDYAKDYYYKALEVRNMIKKQMERVFASNDFILSPTSPILPARIDKEVSPVEMYKQDLFTIPANMIGAPSMSVPMPFKDGLSVGMELTADRFKDDKMIKAALGFERSMR
jgi:aspartyl-tRNA(Asn)/glutamyl-tRNA(Gln) amidotransferase subunit A